MGYFISQGIAYGFSVSNALQIFQFILAEASHAFYVHGYWKIKKKPNNSMNIHW